MENKQEITIEQMKIEDYDEIYELWTNIKGFSIRAIDDSKEGIERFLLRNKETSVVAVCDNKIVGTILCGHDGRSASFYHVCVAEEYRKGNTAKKMVQVALEKLKKEKISNLTLLAFKTNEGGNKFWKNLGWKLRDDINTYDLVLEEKNTIWYT